MKSLQCRKKTTRQPMPLLLRQVSGDPILNYVVYGPGKCAGTTCMWLHAVLPPMLNKAQAGEASNLVSEKEQEGGWGSYQQGLK